MVFTLDHCSCVLFVRAAAATSAFVGSSESTHISSITTTFHTSTAAYTRAAPPSHPSFNSFISRSSLSGASILSLISFEHREAARLYEKYRAEQSQEKKQRLADTLMHELRQHVLKEEFTLYPWMAKKSEECERIIKHSQTKGENNKGGAACKGIVRFNCSIAHAHVMFVPVCVRVCC